MCIVTGAVFRTFPTHPLAIDYPATGRLWTVRRVAPAWADPVSGPEYGRQATITPSMKEKNQ